MASSTRIDELQKKFDESPRRYFAPLANEYRKAGDPDQAIAICREFLPQQPTHMSAHIVYGQALYDTQQFEEARTVFHTALTLDPENLIALRLLGDISCHLGDLASARGWYQRVLDADPRNQEIASILATLAGTPPAQRDAVPARETWAAPVAEPSETPVLHATPVQSAAAEAIEGAAPPVVDATLPEVAAEHEAAAPPIDREWFVALPPVEPAAPPAEPDAPVAGLPADALLDFGSFPGVPEATAVPRAITPSASLYSLGFEIERATDDYSFMPALKAEPATESAGEPPVPAEAEAAESAVVWDVEERVSAELPESQTSLYGASEDEGVGMAAPETDPVVVAAPAEEPAAAEPAGSVSESTDPFATETMAELYVSQGHPDDALRVYHALLARSPGDTSLEAKIASIDAMPAVTPAVPEAAASAPQESEPVAEASGSQIEGLMYFDLESGTDLEMEIPETVAASDLADSAGEPEVQEVPDLDASWFGTPDEPMPAVTQPADLIGAGPTPDADERAGLSIREFLTAFARRAGGEGEPTILQPAVPIASEYSPPDAEVRLTASGSSELPSADTMSQGVGAPELPAMAKEGGSIDSLFQAKAVATPDQAAAATLAGAYGVLTEEPPPAIMGAPARRATEELSLDSVFRDSQAPSAPRSGGFSFDRFFEGNTSGRGTPARQTPAIAQGATTADADIEQFNSWLQGLKKR